MAGSILVVEDEPAIQELVSFACSNGGYRVRRAESVRTAQEAIRHELPDLLILDWMLPDRPGIELLRELRGDERTRGLPIILLTAKGAESDKVAGLDAGADDYVVKPFSPRELVSRVRAVFRRRAPHARRQERERQAEDEQRDEALHEADEPTHDGRLGLSYDGRPEDSDE
jgi:two-component system phosphate regulon response regulator PhoB